MEEILAFTVVAELPHDLALTNNLAVYAFEEAPPWTGWDENTMAGLIGYHGLTLDLGRLPTYRIVFRRARVRSRLPLQAADKAFGEWVTPLLSRWTRVRRRLSYHVAAAIGLHELVTVAGITALLPTRQLPSDTGPTWTEHRVMLALEVLNDFLVALGVESRDARIGPISRSDLPAMVPITVETQPVPTPRRQGGHWLAPLHGWRPVARGRARDIAEAESAAALFRAAREHETAWFPVLELTHTARRDGLAGRYSAGVLSAGTGIEILLSTLVRKVGPIRGWSPQKIEGVLDCGLANILRIHIPALLHTTVDLADAATPWGHW